MSWAAIEEALDFGQPASKTVHRKDLGRVLRCSAARCHFADQYKTVEFLPQITDFGYHIRSPGQCNTVSRERAQARQTVRAVTHELRTSIAGRRSGYCHDAAGSRTKRDHEPAENRRSR